jgi:hypothetical protein
MLGDRRHAAAYWCNLAANHFCRKTTAFGAMGPTTPTLGAPVDSIGAPASDNWRTSFERRNPQPMRGRSPSGGTPLRQLRVGLLGFAGRAGDWPDPAAAGASETAGALNQGFGPDVFRLLFIISVGRLQSPAETAGGRTRSGTEPLGARGVDGLRTSQSLAGGKHDADRQRTTKTSDSEVSFAERTIRPNPD